jgi:hypothetical protein
MIRPTTQTPGSQLGNALGMSPLVAQYQEWAGGRSWSSLPRPVSDFLEGAFGPLAPLVPVGIDTPREDTGRPEPRRWQYPVGWNMPIGTPGSEGLKLVPFASLRQFAEVSSVARACIEIRKNEVLGMKWDIVPTETAEKNMRAERGQHDDWHDRQEEVRDFFKRPDRNFQNMAAWLGALLEDLFVTDALCVWICPTIDKKKGVLGSGVRELWAIDGTTVRPLLDLHGGTPDPPAPGYQQYLWGIPRVETVRLIQDADIQDMKDEYGIADPLDEYRADQMLYLPYLTRNWTPYGFSAVERAILPITTSIKRQQWQLDYFMEGSIPGTFIIPGPDISTRSQQRELQDTLNAIMGDAAWKHKIVVLPPASKSELQKPVELAGAMDHELYVQIMQAFDVMPAELGVAMQRGHGGMGGSQTGSSPGMQQQAEVMERKSLKPLLQWLKVSLFDYVIQEMLGQEDMEWSWPALDIESDAEQKAVIWKTLTSFGALSIDEVRVEMGKSPWGLPQTSDPLVYTAAGAVPLGNIPPALEQEAWDIAPIVAGPDGPIVDPSVQSQQQVDHQQAMNQVNPPPGVGAKPGTGAGRPPRKPGTVGAKKPPIPTGGKTPVPPGPPSNGKTPPDRSMRAARSPIRARTTAARKRVTNDMLQELESMRRYLKKGNDVNAWQADVLPPEVLEKVKDELGVDR